MEHYYYTLLWHWDYLGCYGGKMLFSQMHAHQTLVETRQGQTRPVIVVNIATLLVNLGKVHWERLSLIFISEFMFKTHIFKHPTYTRLCSLNVDVCPWGKCVTPRRMVRSQTLYSSVAISCLAAVTTVWSQPEVALQLPLAFHSMGTCTGR